GERGQQTERLVGMLAERDVVAEVVADAHVLAADLPDPLGVLGGAPALVVLDRQAHAVLPEDWLGALDRSLVRFEAFLEVLEPRELLVATAGERRVRRDRAQLGGGADAGLVRLDVGVAARRRHAHDDAHLEPVELLAQRADLAGVARRADARHAEAERVAVLDDVEVSGPAAVREAGAFSAHAAELRLRRAGLRPEERQAAERHAGQRGSGAGNQFASCHGPFSSTPSWRGRAGSLVNRASTTERLVRSAL